MKSKNIIFSKPFDKAFGKIPKEIRETFYQKLQLFLNNPSHPSLRVKKMRGTQDIWEMSITMNYRLTFEIWEEGVFLRKIGTHDILKTP